MTGNELVKDLTLLSSVVCAIMAVYIWFVTMRNCRSEKKFYFVLMMSALIVYMLGSILELISPEVGGMVAGIKLVYTGANLVSPLFLLFILDYCNFKITKKLIAAILFVPLMTFFPLYTLESHTYFYQSYYELFPSIGVVPGLTFYAINAYTVLYSVIAIAIIINRLIRFGKRFRSTFILLMVAALVPLFAQGAYLLYTYVFETPLSGFVFTPQALVLTNMVFYVVIVRYDMFDFAPRGYSVSFDLILDTIIFLDADLNYCGSNKAASAIFPEIGSFRKGAPITGLANWPDTLSSFSGQQPHNNINFEIPDEKKFFTAQTAPILSKKKIIGYTVLVRDVTEFMTLMARLQESARTDPLTGIHNRRYFLELAELEYHKSKRENRRCGAIMLDADYFKRCNDLYGHHAGDEVLRAISSQIKKTIRPYDIFCRYGGEEFALLLSNVDESILGSLTERIRTLIEQHVCEFEGNKIKITCSIGAALSGDENSLDQLLRHADLALYKAKESGRNKVVVHA